MDQRTSPEYFEILVDPVEFSALVPYEDGRKWIFVQDVDLTLGEVAHALPESPIGEERSASLQGFPLLNPIT